MTPLGTKKKIAKENTDLKMGILKGASVKLILCLRGGQISVCLNDPNLMNRLNLISLVPTDKTVKQPE
jgi:hypothetical protein